MDKKRGEDMAKTECVICAKEIETLDQFNGEMMCEDCYHNTENEVFTDE